MIGVRLGQMFCLGEPPFRLARLDPTPRGRDTGDQRGGLGLCDLKDSTVDFEVLPALRATDPG